MTLNLIGDFDPKTGEAILKLSKKEVKTSFETIELPGIIIDAITKIKQEVDIVNDDKQLQVILDFLKRNYTLKDKKIPENILSLFSHPPFLISLQKYISNKIPHILNNNSNHSFEDISFFVYLLGKGKIQNILNDLNTYDFDKINQIFDRYIQEILSLGDDIQNLDFYFQGYVNLFELFNKLSILNEIDTWRKILIPDIVQILNQKNDILEKKLEENGLLNDEKKNVLLHLRGKLLINFSHIPYISTDNKSIHDILGDFLEIIKNQSNGFFYASSSNFGNNPDRKTNNYQTFIGNMAYAINIMCQKLTGFDVSDILSDPIFIQIKTKFLSHLELNPDCINNLDDLFTVSNNVFASIYFNDTSVLSDMSGDAGKNALKAFIAKDSDKTDFEFESLHHLVMFLPNLSLDEYLEVGFYLVNTKKYNNYNFEFFKLKTLDTIITKIAHIKDNENIIIFLTKIVIYIENNKMVSQLLNTYSRLYLAIAYYYSNSFDYNYVRRSLEFFTIFFKMGGDISDFEKYGRKIEDFYYNIGLYNIKSNFCFENKCDPNFSCDVSHIDCDFNRNQCIRAGQKEANWYKNSYEDKLKNDLDRVLSDLLENALNQNGIEDSEINRKISIVLSNKIFHGIAETYIIDVNENTNFIHDLVSQNGIGSLQIDLFNGYKLCFVYPKIYKDIFLKIYKGESYYIVRNIKNIITSYLKRKDLYIDHNTGLPNELRLKTVLSRNTKKRSFLSIKLNTLKSINNGYSYELGDEYIKNVAQALLKIDGLSGCVYRLSGAKIGIILPQEQKNIPQLIEKIKEIKFQIGTSIHKIDAHIGVVEDEIDRLLEKSYIAIIHAKTVLNGVAFYSEQLDNTQRDKELVDYISKLDKALEENRVVPFYQPLIDTKTLQPHSFESLMRVKTDNGKYDNPLKYLKSAETFGRLIPITNVIIDSVFCYAQKTGKRFSINLSGDDLSNKELISYIKKLIKKYQIDTSKITFEILEGQWNSENNNIKTVKQLKNLGFKIAMDDFGSSNSNINRLLEFLSTGLLDYLKFDAEIIRTLDGTNKPMIDSIDEIFNDILKLDGFVFKDINANINKLNVEEKKQTLHYFLVCEKINVIIDNHQDLRVLLELLKEKIKDININKEYIEDELIEQIKFHIQEKARKMADITKELLSGLISTCHKVGVKTVAEYVSNQTILRVCKDLSIDYIQGYAVGIPNSTIEVLLPEEK